MDFTVYPDTPIARLPRALRGVALLARNIVFAFSPSRRTREPATPEYVYEADGIATVHLSPFLQDERFAGLYAEMASEWFVGSLADARWRMWVLTSLARECRLLPGNYAEFGVYRAGCAFMILGTADLPPDKRVFLFDTFTGIPADALTETEIAEGLAGELSNTSLEYVAQRLSRWSEQTVFVEGDVIGTLPQSDTGPLAFVHMDLNAAEPTHRALEYVYPRLVPGAITVFDDYGWKGLEAQRRVVDAFFSDKFESVLALPTGQGLMIKR